MPSDDLHALVEARLRRAGQRYTAGRRSMVDALARLSRPVSISDLAAELPDLPRSSAYRHLVDLQSSGVARRIAAEDEFARFELAEDLTEHHHHLVCTGCGQVVDITPSRGFEQSVARHLDVLADLAGFEPHSHRVDVLGLCRRCK